MEFLRVWAPYIYLYGVGGIFFSVALWLILRTKACRTNIKRDRFWLGALAFGFLWFAGLHASGIGAGALSDEASFTTAAQEALNAKAGPSNPSAPLFMAIILGYILVVLGFGAWFSRFNKTTSDFFFGGRRFSWWLITMSIVATGVGSHSFLKYSAKGFQHGFSSSMTYLNDWFFMPLFMFGWLPIIYFTRVKSIPEYFERRFDSRVRKLATVALLVYMLGYIAIGFLTMAKTLQPVLQDYMGWDIGLDGIIWAVAIISGIYITFGGQTAVIFTDLLQGFILLLGGALLFILGLNWLGGFDVFWNALPQDFKLPLAHLNKPQDFHTVGIFWQDGIAGSIGFLFLNQGLLMRFMACRSVEDGRKAAAFNTLFLLPLSTIVVCNAGWVGRAISGARPDILPPETSPDEIFTRVTAIVSSPAVFSFLIAAVVAALMSTVDTLINAVAAISINDIYRPLAKNRGDKHYLKAAMWISAIATIIGVLATYPFRGFDTLYEAHAKFHGTVTPPLVAAVFLGAFWKRFTTPAAIATFVGGVALILVGQANPEIFIQPFAHGVAMDPEHPWKYMGALWNLLACFGIGITVSLFTKPESEEKVKGLTLWSVEAARWMFKGSKPNDKIGFKLPLVWKVDPELPSGTVQVDSGAQEGLAANEGDMIYLCDKRWWLGGLRSAHAKLGASHSEANTVILASDVADSAHFMPGRMVTVEKEL
ncbi:MAG: sodium/solute symporter [Planctomycetota bacterium]|jgi:SSS family solute:Na+ symporter|nr:sodium/solute symporter [Planctomycetota bacterium]